MEYARRGETFEQGYMSDATQGTVWVNFKGEIVRVGKPEELAPVAPEMTAIQAEIAAWVAKRRG